MTLTGHEAPAPSPPTPTHDCPDPLDPAAVRCEVDTALAAFLHEQARAAPGPELEPLLAALRSLLHSGGKRLRTQLCLTGWHAAGGHGERDTAVRTAAALELLQAAAVTHDDVMDASMLRRGAPAAHQALATAYTDRGGRLGRAGIHGRSAAVLLGDLALAWSGDLLGSTPLPPGSRERVMPLVSAMHTEMVYGQYLDLLSAGTLSDDAAAALTTARYKTATYTVQRPLHIGAALAGAGPRLLNALSGIALPLGEAFQLRDDLLGVFGDPALTGKPVGDDIRHGTATVLLALALRRASTGQRHLLHHVVGRGSLTGHDLARVRTILEQTGAAGQVEGMIRDRHRQALDALERAPLPGAAVAALRRIADTLTTRQS
ncbi:polyprenyl synthetase family protein [Streptomyces sp. NPDC048290]|uniref:polyprenyl synthetase family protein n=1 Tax=Streptomyces sp. NPDC048290 TaxID=3155811 RepID=UPI003434B234